MRAKAPSNLSPSGRKLWRSLAEELNLDSPGYLMLAVLCEIHDRREQARQAIAKDGAMIKDRWEQLKASPWLAVERDATLALQRAFHSLGLDLEPSEQ
jgi:P27 family predicted phage terminase small subunit